MTPPKVSPSHAAGAAPLLQPRQSFKAALGQAKPVSPKPTGVRPPLPRPAGPAKATSQAVASRGTSQVLRPQAARVADDARAVARHRVDSEAQRLGTVRAGHHEHSARAEAVRETLQATPEDQRSRRMVEAIAQDLRADPAMQGQPPPSPQPAGGANAGTSGGVRTHLNEPTPRHAQALALIEKIEVFVRSQRPAMQLTLNQSLGAKVEIERVGPKAIALKLVGKNGPLPPAAIDRLRDELRTRGIEIATLSNG